MGKRVITAVARMPRNSCPACHGFGAVRMTVHFHSGDMEFEAPCWECFGTDAKIMTNRAFSPPRGEKVAEGRMRGSLTRRSAPPSPASGRGN